MDDWRGLMINGWKGDWMNVWIERLMDGLIGHKIDI